MKSKKLTCALVERIGLLLLLKYAAWQQHLNNLKVRKRQRKPIRKGGGDATGREYLQLAAKTEAGNNDQEDEIKSVDCETDGKGEKSWKRRRKDGFIIIKRVTN
uniref:Uncharacterized protein n=1 Tax=Syphacia muris TaxID=451379 RepID=A0A0N5AWV2_9BILA